MWVLAARRISRGVTCAAKPYSWSSLRSAVRSGRRTSSSVPRIMARPRSCPPICAAGITRRSPTGPIPMFPSFHLGTKDGETIRDLIGNAPAGDPPHIKIRLDADFVSGQKSALVWGTLPGRDGRDDLCDRAPRRLVRRGRATMPAASHPMIGLAEYFAKLPKSQRRRTMIFIGSDGHHSIRPGEFGNEWLLANRDRLFAKTALMINDEHPAEMLTHGGAAGATDTHDAAGMVCRRVGAARASENHRRRLPAVRRAALDRTQQGARRRAIWENSIGSCRAWWRSPTTSSPCTRQKTRPPMCHGPGWKR